MDIKSLSTEYICTHLGEEGTAQGQKGAVVPPIYATSLHVFESTEDMLGFNAYDGSNRYTYGRVDNPTVKLLETKIAAIEQAEGCACFASGMAAITSALMYGLKPGGHLVCVNNAYGPTRTFIDNNLKNLGIEVTYVTGSDPMDFERAVKANTQVFYLESPSSLVLELQDLQAVVAIAKKHNIITMIDNTYSAGIYQKPLNMGVDITIHTLSKYFGGHSDVIGGALCANAQIVKKIRDEGRELYGGILGPFEAWLVIRSLRSLMPRLRASSQNALSVAQMLEKHPKIRRVNYPLLESFKQYELAKRQMSGACGLISFEPNLTLEQTVKFTNNLKLFQKGVSWGGFESLCVMPMYKFTDAEALNRDTTRNLVRMYCGLENIQDLINDIEQALANV